jgi:HPt (histidine-containing phosphotransfer) domain-containing protein
MVSTLKKGVEENNLKIVMETAHKLKGSCGQFGAVQLARLCAEVGEQGENGTLHGMTELIGHISKTATETESFFQGMLD